MNNLLETGGAGGIGAVIGVVISFLGFKSRLDIMEKRVENSVSEGTCHAAMEGIEKVMDLQAELMTEMRDDIKELIRK